MISALKSGLRGGLFYLVLVFLVLFLIQYFIPVNYSSICINPLTHFLNNVQFLKHKTPVFIINIIPVLLSLRVLTKMIVSYSIIDKNNIFPVFILLFHLGITARNLFEIQLRYWAIFLQLYSYFHIIITYKKEKLNTEFFLSGFFLMLTFYLDPFFMFLLPLMIISLFSFRALKAWDLFSFVSGAFFSAVITEFLLHILDIISFYPFRFLAKYNDFLGLPSYAPGSFISFTFIFVILNFSIFYLSLQTSGISVFMSKNRQIMIYWVFLACVTFFIRCEFWEYVFLIILIPFSILTGEMFFYLKNKKVQMIIFYLLLFIYFLHFLFSREFIKI